MIMTTEIMTVHEALSELKVIGKRIEKELTGVKFVTTNKHCNTKIDGVDIKTYSDNVIAKYNKVVSLIKRRAAIKKAITFSNANTVVDIAGTKMTIAEAIEYKVSGIDYKEKLLDSLMKSYDKAKYEIQSFNGEALSENATRYVERAYTNKDSVNKDVIENARQKFIEDNTYDLIDPIGADKEIQKLADEIDAFTSKVDSALSVSNATTKITIEY